MEDEKKSQDVPRTEPPQNEEMAKVASKAPAQDEDYDKYPHGVALWVITAALYSTLFLVALDRTIIATAIPAITDRFSSISDISWYASAYLITSCSTQLLWGRVFTFYSTKIVYLGCVILFEVGSALCGAAPSSTAFIIGRAISGIGAAGITAGSTIIVTQIVPLSKRPVFVGSLGAVFGISSIVGPLLGGAFTDHVSWRWCFYINLPFGAVVFAALVFYLKVEELSHENASLPLAKKLLQLDPLGTFVFLPGMICLLLALQWGGVEYPWSDGRIITLFVLAGVLIIAFIGIQIWRKEAATVPPRIVKQRSIFFGCFYSLLMGGCMLVLIYTLPIWFQAVKKTSAVQSGINMFPLTIGMVLGVIPAGIVVQKTGYYVPPMFFCVVVTSIAVGLITTWEVGTSSAKWIGYQAMFGIGLGAGMQQAVMAAQTVLPQVDVAIGVALMFFFQNLGAAIWICISQTLFVNYLSSHLATIKGLDIGSVVHAGATELSRIVPLDKMQEVLEVYNDALIQAIYVSVGLCCALIIPTLGMEWKSVKAKEQVKSEAQPAPEAEV